MKEKPSAVMASGPKGENLIRTRAKRVDSGAFVTVEMTLDEFLKTNAGRYFTNPEGLLLMEMRSPRACLD